jgi:hypothetical protein
LVQLLGLVVAVVQVSIQEVVVRAVVAVVEL